MTQVKMLLLAATAVGSIASATAAEATITVNLTGYVYQQTADTTTDFHLGQATSAWFTFDENATGQTFSPGGILDPNIRFYRYAPTSGGMKIGNYTVTFSSAARMFVTNDEVSQSRTMDRVLFDDFGAIGGSIAGRSLDVASIGFNDFTSSLLQGLDLQSAAVALPNFTDIRATLDWNPYLNAEHRISMSFGSPTVTNNSAVPEPATWAMMVLGMCAVGYMLRQRRPAEQCFFAA